MPQKIGRKTKDGVFLEASAFVKLKTHFETPNLKKQQMKRMQMYGWHKLKDSVEHWKKEGDSYRIPFGYYAFNQDWFDTVPSESRRVAFPELRGSLRPDQESAVSALVSKPGGLLHASTGVGKTWMLAAVAKELGTRTLVVCDAIGRMEQMREDLEEIFGVKYLTLSGKKTKQKGASDDVVIANIDTVLKQPREFLDGFGLVLVDECDRTLQADARREWIASLSPEYLYGVTGTVKLNHVDDRVFPIHFGPKSELLKKNYVPTVHQVYTDFRYSEGELSDVKDFHLLKADMYCDHVRNALIVETVKTSLGARKGILFCEYVDHAKLLKETLESEGIKCFFIIGEVSGADRETVRSELTAYAGPCVLIGSKACVGRGFNVPELSVGYLCVTEKFTSSIEQYVGRVLREFPGKKGCDWYDFVDRNVSMLNNQAKNRAVTYRREYPGCKFTQSFQDDFDF